MGLFRRKVDPKVLERQKELGIIAQMGAFYEFGLPIEPGTWATLSYMEDKITIEVPGAKFNLLLDNISAISMRVGGDTQESGDVGGAIAGGMIAGPIGAMIGGSSVQLSKFYMIITYNSRGRFGRIGFSVTGSRKGRLIKELFDKRPKKEIEVNL